MDYLYGTEGVNKKGQIYYFLFPRFIPQLIHRTFHYKKGPDKQELAGSSECVVCLNEFQEDEKLRGIIPNYGNDFHIDCIDVWLQNNANCLYVEQAFQHCQSYDFQCLSQTL